MIIPRWPAPQNVCAFTLLPDERLEDAPPVVLLNQVHGTKVIPLPADVPLPLTADAAYTGQAHTPCMVRTADCLPILLTNLKGTEVAAIHAGWRGLAAGIIFTTLSALKSRPDVLLIWLGPAISQRAFEVGDEVHSAFTEKNPASEAAFRPGPRKGHYYADLCLLARIRLLQAGVLAKHIFSSEICTYHDPAMASYRRNRTVSRQHNLIWFE